MCEHNENCRYHNMDAKMLYACIKVPEEEKFITISAFEVALFDDYLEASLNDDKELIMDLDETDREPFQIVYGGVFVNRLYDSNKYSDPFCQDSFLTILSLGDRRIFL